jgi:hypothetical protein
MYRGRARLLDRILSGTDLLVVWRYQPDEWARYATAEHLRERAEKRALFIVIAVISLVVAVGFLVMDPDSGRFVAAVLFGVVLLCALAAVLSTRAAHRRNLRRVGEALIAPGGLYLNRVLHTWSGAGERLESVSLEDGDAAFVQFVYSARGKGQRQEASVRVPVPRGQEQAARWLVDQFAQRGARGVDDGER